MKLKELFFDETKWTQRQFAKTINGMTCDPNDPVAHSFCFVGGLRHCYNCSTNVTDLPREIRKKLTKHFDSYKTILLWNDLPTTTFEKVKALVEELDI